MVWVYDIIRSEKSGAILTIFIADATDQIAGDTPSSARLALRSRARNALWIGISFCTALGLAAAVLAAAGADDQGVHLALLATARLAFLLFWPAYVGSALASLFGPTFEPLRRQAREFGLAFAAALFVHLGLVAWLCLIGDVPPVRTFIVFGAAALCVCLLTLFSIARFQQFLGARAWSLLRFGGMNYVACAFADDFLRNKLAGDIRHALFYWPFMALAMIGPILRAAAIIQALRSSMRKPNSGLGGSNHLRRAREQSTVR